MPTDFSSCNRKQENIIAFFADCKSMEEKYQKIIELGRTLPSMDPQYKTEPYRVQGCQSLMYLYAQMENGVVVFTAESDALISSGLAALLLRAYNRESPETILSCPPTFLDQLGITANLSPNRANGLHSLFLRMKQETLKFLLSR